MAAEVTVSHFRTSGHAGRQRTGRGPKLQKAKGAGVARCYTMLLYT
jgi:hypothetical protein